MENSHVHLLSAPFSDFCEDSNKSPMFFRTKPAKGYRFLQIARSVRRGKTVRQESSPRWDVWMCCGKAVK
jgi:hypothetical protein